MKTLILLVVGLGTSGLVAKAQFNSGSTGTVALHIISDTTLDLPPSGVLHYTTITVESNTTLRFNRNSNNTPAYLLATGDVKILGTIDVSGGNATTNAPWEPGRGGPGGFDGGWPGDNTVLAGDGYGPGGGKAGLGLPSGRSQGDSDTAGAGSYYSIARGYDGNSAAGYASLHKGATYGSLLLVPLVGGSGGGGINGTPGQGGGGGGGAVLVASTTRIVVSGMIRADGGDGSTFLNGILQHLNPGSGGAIRLVAPIVDGPGTLEAWGPSTGNLVANYGRVRIDSIDLRNVSQLTVVAARSVGNYMVVFPNPVPRLDIINAAGTAITPGSGPVTIQLPNGAPTAQFVTVQASNFNASVTVQIAVTPQSGSATIYQTNLDNLAQNPATGTVSVTVPVSTPVTVSAWTKVP